MDLKNFYRNKKVLITGGLGFIGSTLAHRLVEYGTRPLLVDALIPDYGGNLFNIEAIKGKVDIEIADVRDIMTVNDFVKGQDIIFNLAGTLSHIDSLKDPYTDLEINCRSQLSILEACRNFNPKVKIIFAGTRNQYGAPRYLPVDENHPLIPTDINGINNIAGESYHILYHKLYGTRAVSLRLTNTYGPRHQMKHPRQGIINWFIRQAIENKEMKLYGDGGQIRDMNYVDDVVEAFLISAMNEKINGEVFNLGGTPASLLELVKTLVDITGRGKYKLIPFPPKRKKIEIGDYVADIRKIKKIINWKPKTELRRGLEKTLSYYQKYRKHYW